MKTIRRARRAFPYITEKLKKKRKSDSGYKKWLGGLDKEFVIVWGEALKIVGCLTTARILDLYKDIKKYETQKIIHGVLEFVESTKRHSIPVSTLPILKGFIRGANPDRTWVKVKKKIVTGTYVDSHLFLRCKVCRMEVYQTDEFCWYCKARLR